MNPSIEEIINKFENGYERFHVDPQFKSIVMAMYYGADPIGIIDSLIRVNNDLIIELEKQILNRK